MEDPEAACQLQREFLGADVMLAFTYATFTFTTGATIRVNINREAAMLDSWPRNYMPTVNGSIRPKGSGIQFYSNLFSQINRIILICLFHLVARGTLFGSWTICRWPCSERHSLARLEGVLGTEI